MRIFRETNTEEIRFCEDDAWDEDIVTIYQASDLFTVNCSCDPEREYAFLSEGRKCDLMKESIKEVISRIKDRKELMEKLTEMFQQKFGYICVA